MKKQGFLFGSVVLMASAVIVKVLGAMFRIPLANMLGGSGMGYFSAAYSIFMPVYAVSVTGLPAACARSVSAAFARGDRQGAYMVRKTALKLYGAIGFGAMLLLFFGAYPVCLAVSGDIAALPAVMMIAPSVLAGCLISAYRGYYEGMRDMSPTAVSQVIEGAAKLIFGLSLCYLCRCLMISRPETFESITGGGEPLPYCAAAAALGVALSSFAGLIYMIVKDRRETPRDKSVPRRDEEKRIRKELLKIALPAAVGALVTNLTSMIDLVTVMRSVQRLTEKAPWVFSRLLGEGIAYKDMPNFVYGSFAGLAVTVFNLVPSLTNMFGKSMLPAAAAAKESGDAERLRKCCSGAVLAAALVSFPAGFGISALSEPALRLLFSGHEAEIWISTAPLRVLGIAVPFLCISTAAFALLQAAGRADIPVKLMGAGAAVKLLGNIILTSLPSLNITGAAVSTLLCYIFICVMSLFSLKKVCGYELGRQTEIIFRIFSAAFLCGSGAFVIQNTLSERGNILAVTAVSCLLGFIIYILVTYFAGIITKSTLKMLIY